MAERWRPPQTGAVLCCWSVCRWGYKKDRDFRFDKSRHLVDPAHKICYHEVITRPPEGDFLRQQFADIIPGYYMNKVHWNSVCTDGAVPDDLLKEMLDKSYALVLSGFSKKKQQEILGR